MRVVRHRVRAGHIRRTRRLLAPVHRVGVADADEFSVHLYVLLTAHLICATTDVAHSELLPLYLMCRVRRAAGMQLVPGRRLLQGH